MIDPPLVSWPPALRAATLLLALLCAPLLSCEPPRQRHTITFEARASDTRVTCEAPAHLAAGQTFSLRKLRFYIHDLAMRDSDGLWHAAHAAPGQAQQVAHDVWLVDLDDAACDPSSAPRLDTLNVTLPKKRYDALRFTLGVPFDLNHADPLAAPPPLALTSMHWGWQAGYRFLRFDAQLDEATSYALHLGSTGCHGEIGAISSCDRSNRPTFTLPLERADSPHTTVSLSLDRLLHQIPLSEARNCMGEPTEPDCRLALIALGLDPDTGLASATPAATPPFEVVRE